MTEHARIVHAKIMLPLVRRGLAMWRYAPDLHRFEYRVASVTR